MSAAVDAPSAPLFRAPLPRDAGRTTVALAVGTTIAGSMPTFLLGALFVALQHDLEAPSWVLGLAVAVYWAAAAVTSMTAGSVVSAIGARSTTIISLAVAALSLAGSALLAPTWPLLVVWAAVGGVANGLGHPASNQLMAVRVRGSRLATAFGIKQGAVPFAAFLAGLAVPALALTLGWHWGFGAAAGLSLLLLGAFLWLGPRRSPRGTARPRSERLTPELLRYLVLMLSATTIGAAAAGAVAAFAVLAGVERGVEPGVAAAVLSAGSLLGAVVRMLSGRAADRTSGRIALPLTAALLASGAVGSVMLSIDTGWAFIVGVLIALGPGWGWTGLTHFTVSRVAGPATPAATGLVQTGSYLGSGAGPLLFGLAFAAVAGMPAHALIWLPVAGLQLIAAVVIIVLIRTPVPRQPTEDEAR